MKPLTFLLLFCALSGNNNSHAKTVQSIDNLEDEVIYQKYVEMDKNLKNLVNRGVKMLFPYIMEANEYLNLSSSCKRDAFQLLTGIRNLKLSALKILDAVGKAPAGLFTGNVHMLGDYEECMSTSVLLKDGNVAYKGEYCMVYLRSLLPKQKRLLTLDSGLEELVEATKNTSDMTQFVVSFTQLLYNTPIKFGLCVPSGCSSHDVNLFLNYVNEKVSMNATVAYCNQQDNLPSVPKREIAIIVSAILGIVTLIGSFLDYYSRRKGIAFENTTIRIVLCFSLIANFPKVINTKISEKSLSSLFGLRSLSVFYVVLLHEYYIEGRFQVQGHVLRYRDMIPQFFTQIILNGSLAVEVFFFLGGFLNVYMRLKVHESQKGKNLSKLLILVHRLWRIYPAYLCSMGIAYLLANKLGPTAIFAKEVFLDNCATKWWQNLLFINSFFNQADTCMFHTWYIAVDMQLFLISLFTVPVLLKCAKKGIILHVAILIAGMTSSVAWAWYKGIMPSNILYELDWSDKEKIWNVYASFMPHVAPYFTGMITSYIIFTWKDFKISLFYQIVGWPIAAVCLISMLFITTIWNAGVKYTLLESAFYFTFSRFVYIAAVAWLVTCCVKGYGGIINYILSLKIWVPIARISFMMYLVSPLLEVLYFAGLQLVIDNSRITVIWRYMGTLAISGLMALAATTIAESPFVALEKLLIHRKMSATKENNGKIQTEKNEKIQKENNEETRDRTIVNGQTEIELEKNLKNTFENEQFKI